MPDKEEVWIKDDCSSFTLSPGEEGKKSRFLFFGLDCEADMTMQTLIAVCDSLWLDSTANMLDCYLQLSGAEHLLFKELSSGCIVADLLHAIFPPLPCFLVLQ